MGPAHGRRQDRPGQSRRGAKQPCPRPCRQRLSPGQPGGAGTGPRFRRGPGHARWPAGGTPSQRLHSRGAVLKCGPVLAGLRQPPGTARETSDNSENPMTRERAHAVRTRAGVHPEGGYRVSSCAKRKLQCVTGERWVPRPDRRIGVPDSWAVSVVGPGQIARFGLPAVPERQVRTARYWGAVGPVCYFAVACPQGIMACQPVPSLGPSHPGWPPVMAAIPGIMSARAWPGALGLA